MNHQTERVLTVGSLFSGIGGLDLGLERAGMRVVWQCEIDPYCRAVLRHHWPETPCYEDIRELCTQGGWWIETVDVLAGGFPCQPLSVAGRRLEDKDPRWLWPEFARLVGVLRPRFVLVENVPGLRGRGLSFVTGDLAALGYDAEWNTVAASSVAAPHFRQRFFVVAYPRDVQLRLEHRGSEWEGGEGPTLAEPDGSEWVAGSMADAQCSARHGARPAAGTLFQSQEVERLGRRGSSDGGQWAVEPNVGRVAHGVSNRLAQLRALGNAVVPQVAEAVGRMIVAAA